MACKLGGGFAPPNLVLNSHFRFVLLPMTRYIVPKWATLPKAVFFLFLRHPEGIVFKDLPDYQKELSNIYLELSGRNNITKLKESVRDATDPTQNSINEKCARIREAFLQHIDESIARNYFVTGERGLAKKIILPRDLVEWECDFWDQLPPKPIEIHCICGWAFGLNLNKTFEANLQLRLHLTLYAQCWLFLTKQPQTQRGCVPNRDTSSFLYYH